MPKLTVLPELDIISGFRNTIDFYIHHQTCPAETGEVGTPCARRWPRSPGHLRSPAVMAQWSAFSEASQYWSQVSSEIQDAYNKMAEGTGVTGRDLFTRSYITGIYRYPTA
ncbi:hypothetical protein ES703_78602 [subsurface metagenome]